MVGVRAVSIGEGQAALIDPGQTHAARATAWLVSVALEPTFVDDLLAQLGWYQAGAHPAYRASVVTDRRIAEIGRLLADELGWQQSGRDLMVDALIRQLGIHLLRTHLRLRRTPAVELSRAGQVDPRLRRALELMHDRCGEELSLKDLAASVFLSEHYFAHLFKEITGLTPHAYLANVRIERARALLLETDLAITRIAAQVGYRSSAHFAHAFRAVTGTTPRAYRAAARGAFAPNPPKVRN
jgi:AraC family transcriptional regulator